MFDFDRNLLLLIIEAISKIEKYTSGIQSSAELANDPKSFDASLMNFVVIAECVGKLSDSFKTSHSEIEWKKVYAFRNFIAHDYFGIDEEEVWDIISFHLPLLKQKISEYLNSCNETLGQRNRS